MANRKAAAAPASTGGLVLRRKQFVGLKTGATRPILVELAGAPKVVVQATNTEEAWEKYKALCGIRSTEHRPVFRKPNDDVMVNEAGVVVNEVGLQQFADLKKVDGRQGDWNLDEEEID